MWPMITRLKLPPKVLLSIFGAHFPPHLFRHPFFHCPTQLKPLPLRHQASLTTEHLAFFDWREVDRQLQEFKNERAWFNLNLPADACRALLQDPSWYSLFIPPQEMEIGRFDRVFRWQEIAVALLKKYADVFFY